MRLTIGTAILLLGLSMLRPEQALAAPVLNNCDFSVITVNGPNCLSFKCWTGLLAGGKSTSAVNTGTGVGGFCTAPLVLCAATDCGTGCSTLTLDVTQVVHCLVPNVPAVANFHADTFSLFAFTGATANATVCLNIAGQNGLLVLIENGGGLDCPECLCVPFTPTSCSATITVEEIAQANSVPGTTATAFLDPQITITQNAGGAPEIDASAAALPAAVALGILLVVADRRKRRPV